MKVKLVRVDDAFHFEGEGSSPVKVNIDAAEAIGGGNKGARPMELVVMGFGGCSAIDIISILQKQKQKISEYEIELNAERYNDRIPSTFKSIDTVHLVKGDINEKKLVHAMKLSITKYCSVSEILKPTTRLRYYYKLNNGEVKEVEVLK